MRTSTRTLSGLAATIYAVTALAACGASSKTSTGIQGGASSAAAQIAGQATPQDQAYARAVETSSKTCLRKMHFTLGTALKLLSSKAFVLQTATAWSSCALDGYAKAEGSRTKVNVNDPAFRARVGSQVSASLGHTASTGGFSLVRAIHKDPSKALERTFLPPVVVVLNRNLGITK